jgi:hypothetical protein
MAAKHERWLKDRAQYLRLSDEAFREMDMSALNLFNSWGIRTNSPAIQIPLYRVVFARLPDGEWPRNAAIVPLAPRVNGCALAQTSRSQR